MPLMDLQETLRFHPPVYHMHRMAAADNVIPLELPIKNAQGEYVNEIPVKAGQSVLLSVCGYQR